MPTAPAVSPQLSPGQTLLSRTPRTLPWSAWVVGAGLFLALGGRWLVQRGLDLALAEQIQDTGALHEFVATLAQVLSGVLGFTLSVVAIVVQLSADRFTPKVTELFLREKVNFYIFFFLILANVVSLWSSMALSIYERPAFLIGLNLLLGTASFLVLIPYFNFVFHFLQPASIIHRIEQQVQQAVLGSLAAPAYRCSPHQPDPARQKTVPAQFWAAHQRCLSALDEIKGIATSAIRQQEGIILLDALDSLKAFWLFYAARKDQLPQPWFLLSPALRRDPDFVSVDEGLLRQIETEGSWVELKILRQYQTLFAEGLNGMRQVSTLVAIHSRELGIRALQGQNQLVARWVVKFFNTYLRAVINTQDIRTGYNLLKQYRMVAEAALRSHQDALVLEIVGHFRYYSLIAYKAGLFFLSETFGFDLGLLAQLSCALHSNTTEAILQILLRLDQDPESEQQESTLRGIRKTQVRLAAYFLSCGREDLAKLIYLDMHHEPLVRLQIIRQELQSTTAEFWEFTDRGENFYYLDPTLQPYADQFFGWFPVFSPQMNAGQEPLYPSGQGSLEPP
ncbi:DUF2254 family protein [Thermostichus vulcanus]|uniref:DUF2254 domain-containing protein n=1 Tax=Thermostichus vulcanus str. 'Rupite' TaxID=2813851 RepID=A0ABT0CEX6_THEVL|nr:DUF2254 family protein [Thermostichus vulcanus]MCJ2544333.1 DUF2254 domain-containing protein [Thermostichus vulcanus str. 'Rupite']